MKSLKTFPTDEDGLIYHLTVHKNMITWMLKRLADEGIQARRTRGNDRRGDIEILNAEDVPSVQQIIRRIQEEDTT